MCFNVHALTGDDVMNNGDVNNNETDRQTLNYIQFFLYWYSNNSY